MRFASPGSRFAVVVSRFNELVTRALLAGALETFRRYEVLEKNLEVRHHCRAHPTAQVSCCAEAGWIILQYVACCLV